MLTMWRTLLPAVTIVVPIIFGMGLLYLYVGGTIGIATLLAASFALAAVAVTAVLMDEGDDETDNEAAGPPRARQ